MNFCSVEAAVELLKSGELVIIPTETVYGLAADGLDERAVEKIYLAKDRPRKNPLILHVNSLEMAKKLVKVESFDSARVQKAVQKFWPGPLTLIFDKSALVPDIVTAGLSTVCVRMPAHPTTLEIIKKLGHPLAAPSANRSGRPSPTTPADAFKEMPDLQIVNGGACHIGLESTVVDLRGERTKILRLGGLSAEQLQQCLGEKIEVFQPSEIVSPGQLFKHYAPEGEIILVWPPKNIADLYAHYAGQWKTGIICTVKGSGLHEGKEILPLGDSLEEQAKNLYRTLHETEHRGWQKILIDMRGIGGDEGLGKTILERLQRAAERE